MSCLKCVICVPSGSQLSSVKYQVSCNCKSQAASMDFLMCSGLYKMHNGMVSTKKMHNWLNGKTEVHEELKNARYL